MLSNVLPHALYRMRLRLGEAMADAVIVSKAAGCASTVSSPR